MKAREEIGNYLENVSLLILGLLFASFPLVFSTMLTDTFATPKQILLGVGVILTIILLIARMVNDGEVRIRKSPFDLPIFLFGFIVLLSAVLSLNQSDALVAYAPVLFGVFLYFAVVSAAKTEGGVIFLLTMLILGGSLASIFALLQFLGIYILPMQYTHNVNGLIFTPFGSLLDQALYFAGILPVTLYFTYSTLYPVFKSHKQVKLDPKAVGFGIATLILAIGLVATILDMTRPGNQPAILPFSTGFQTAFAAISQDTTHAVRSFLLGSGYGTFLTDFTRFKTPAFNANSVLWSFTFFRSSSFILELLATTGVLGLLSFIFLIYRIIKERPLKKEGFSGVFFAAILVIALGFILPFSFIPLTLLFIILGLFAAIKSLVDPNRVYDISLGLVAMRKNMNIFGGREERSFLAILPILLLVIMLIVFGVVAYFGGRYVLSDITFEKSLAAAQQNNGLLTYQLEQNAIQMYPYREAYYRIFSQTNLALANSLASSQPKGASPSAQTQQTIFTLVQQSITAGRSAVTLSPLNTIDWQNLSSIYRSLIGFGQNAQDFSIAANQQAIALDPANPQEYINLGGIYYQLAQWDNAILAFQQAVTLKPDYANAHYNLGHAYESKGDLQNALTQYQVVAQLVANDKTNSAKIGAEIKALQDKIGKAGNNPSAAQGSANAQTPLQVSTPSAQLPERNPPVNIPGPNVTVAPTNPPK